MHPNNQQRPPTFPMLVLVFTFLALSVFLLAPSLWAAPPAAATPLSLVQVAAPDINCVFAVDCTITVTDFISSFTIPKMTGEGLLISRQWPAGEVGTQGEGLYAYLYRIDLSNMAPPVGAAGPCVEALTLDFGPVEQLRYNADRVPDDAFVVVKGGVGEVEPVGVEQDGNLVTFRFKPGACVGNPQSDDTHYFGLASQRAPRTVTAKLTGSQNLGVEAQARVPGLPSCTPIESDTQIPSPGLINFEDLTDAVTIGAHYQSTHGVVFEDGPNTKAISYDHANHPTEPTTPHSGHVYALNNAVHPTTSAGIPMVIKFDAPKTHVGLYMGNGQNEAIALLIAYDAKNTPICRYVYQGVPEKIEAFVGFHDPAGRIASLSLDYGQTSLSEAIDDLSFAPNVPATATPTNTPVPPTATPTNTPVPPTATPTNTPIAPLNPIVAAPYLPVQSLALETILIQKDLAIHGIEITQGIQCFDATRGLGSCADNSLPVIAKKDTTARIYLKYSSALLPNGSQNNVPVRLHIFANGVEYLANASGKATTTINQGNSDSADIYFNVNFSNDINVSFYAEVDPNNAIVETNEGNNRFPASGTINLNFRKSKTLDVVGTRLRYHPSGYGGQQYAGGWAVNGGAADWLEQVLPLRNNGIDYSLSSGYLNWTGSLGSGDGQHDLIRYLNSSYILQNAFAWLFTGPYTGAEHVYGWAPNAGYSGGHADMPVYPHAGGLGKVGIGTDRTSDGANSTDDPGGGALIFGHELVHDYDVLHTDTADACGSADDNSDFPYGSSSIQEYGFNPITGKIYDPALTHDLMSYCPAGGSKEGWIAPFTWNKMAGKLDAAIVAAASTHGTQATSGFLASAAAQSLVVNATVYNPAAPGFDPNKPGKLGDLYLIDTGVEFPVVGGNYAIQLRKGEEILATRSFSLSFESEYSAHTGEQHEEQPGNPADLTKADISFILPWVDGTNTVALVKDGQVLDTRQISANKPTVTVTSPNTDVEWPAGSIQTLTWQGSDVDGDALRYTVFFSADGGASWEIMATEVTTPSLEIEVDALAGTANGKFRVVATDGVNIGQADSATVKIPNKAPTAAISDPVNGKIFIPGQLVVLQGAALDLEDGRLGDESLKWASDKQGVLGSGPSLPVNNLQPGEHTITLNVVDSQGAAGSATAKVVVGYQVYLPSISK